MLSSIFHLLAVFYSRNGRIIKDVPSLFSHFRNSFSRKNKLFRLADDEFVEYLKKYKCKSFKEKLLKLKIFMLLLKRIYIIDRGDRNFY
jgi:hypothetical protein